MAEILIADDDPANRTLMEFVLEQQGHHHVRSADSAMAALQLMGVKEPDLLVLDVMMPGISGLELCRQLRRGGTLPILMISGKGEVSDRITGLRAGADDFLPKPFDPTELIERVNALLRRARRTDGESGSGIVRAGRLRLDLARHHLWVGQRGPTTLTTTECSLLHIMLTRPDAILTREELLRHLWDLSPTYRGPATAVESQVTRLRQKMEPHPRRPIYLVTVRGAGYRLRPNGA